METLAAKTLQGILLPVIRDENIDFEVRAMAGSSAVLLGENDLADELVPFLHSNHQSWSYDRDRIARAIGGFGRQDLAEKLVSKLYRRTSCSKVFYTYVPEYS